MGLYGWHEMTNEERARASLFIKYHRWIFAKTYAAFCPYEYSLREENQDQDFKDFAELVWKYGFDARCRKDAGRCLIVDDGGGWCYFVFPGDVDDEQHVKSTMTRINRTNLSQWKFVREIDAFGSEIVIKPRQRGEEWEGRIFFENELKK